MQLNVTFEKSGCILTALDNQTQLFRGNIEEDTLHVHPRMMFFTRQIQSTVRKMTLA